MDTAGRAWAVFLDFDGTLVDIAERPDAVLVEPDLPGVLARLRDASGGALAVVSGRPIVTLDSFLHSDGFDAVGLHGLEARIGGRLLPCRPDEHPGLRRGIGWLRETLDAPGIVIEDKGCSVGVHWRLAPDQAARAAQAAEELALALGPEYRIQHGKMVAEVLPAHAGKGGAIARFLEQPPYAGRIPLFVGDDRFSPRRRGRDSSHVSRRLGDGVPGGPEALGGRRSGRSRGARDPLRFGTLAIGPGCRFR
jgi:trehalose 6-phosphate phosphatase